MHKWYDVYNTNCLELNSRLSLMTSDMPSCLKVEWYSQEYQISGGHIL